MDKVIKDAPFNGRTPEQYWTDTAKEKLLNRKIVALRYMSEKESEEKYGWYSRTIILTLDDGRQLTVQSDDEGNNAGVFVWISPNEYTTHPQFPNQKFIKTEVIPVI